MKTRSLNVWMNGELVGSWTFKTGAQEFAYDEAWMDSPSARPISLSMPLRPGGKPYAQAQVATFFDNLLPDNEDIRRRLQRRFQTGSIDAFDLLAEIGRDCIGALQLLPPDEKPANLHRIRGEPMSDAGIERHLSVMLGSGLTWQDDETEKEFRISLAGAQEKTALLWHEERWHRPLGSTPTTHILKLPIGVANQGIDLRTSVENEWLCGEILRAFGLPVARSRMQTFGSQKTLVVERFDRRLSDDKRWWIRLPQEDLCQATGTPPELKYENEGGPGVRRIMELLLGSTHAEEDRRNFLQTQLIFWLLCAIDGHAKNFSVFLEAGGGYRLTPLYDILSAHPVLGGSVRRLSPHKVKLAMAVEGKNRHYIWNTIQPRHWIETAHRCGMKAQMERIIAHTVGSAPAVAEAVNKLVPKDFPAEVLDPILSGMEQTVRRLSSTGDVVTRAGRTQ